MSHCGGPIRWDAQKRWSVPPSFCVFRPRWVWIARRRSADCSILIVREPPALLRKSLRGRAPQARGYGASAGEGSDVMDAVWRSRRFGLRGQVHLVTETLQALDQIALEPFRILFVKVIYPQVVVLYVVFEHVIENH